MRADPTFVPHWFHLLSLRTQSGIESFLTHRRLPLVLGLLVVLASLPGLAVGFMWDDVVHHAWLNTSQEIHPELRRLGLLPDEPGALRTAMMEQFAYTGPDRTARDLMQMGIVPWWSSPAAELRFWRPLASVTHWLDHLLWPNSTSAMHLQNAVWLGAGVGFVSLIYRRFLGMTWVAGLAAVLYAFDDAFFLPVAWIAGRNTIMAVVFGALTLLAHDRWRREGRRRLGALSWLALAACLLSSEFGLSVVCYLVGYSFFLDRGPLEKRLGALLPAFMVCLVWWVSYRSLGYGVHETGMYVDPVDNPAFFTAGLVERGPLLVLGQWGIPPAALNAYLSPPLSQVHWFIAVMFVPLLAVWIGPLILRDRVAAFFATGMILSLVLASSGSPAHDRRLLFAGIGAMGLVGRLLSGWYLGDPKLPQNHLWRRLMGTSVAALLIMHLGLAVGVRAFIAGSMAEGNRVGEETALVSSVPDLAGQILVVVNSPSPFTMLFTPYLRAQAGLEIPRRLRTLAPAYSDLELLRTSDRSLVVQTTADSLRTLGPEIRYPPVHPVYYLWQSNDVFRARAQRSSGREPILLEGVEISVIEVGSDGFPKRVSFTFDRSLDDPDLTWVYWDWQRWDYVAVELPEVGRSRQVQGPLDGEPVPGTVELLSWRSGR